ncbi:hypothetical protein ACFPM3_20240 [Streptomyces coeruleoprunus]|uniref:Uncharacterized protein n=1 Tax=Streptomyces coeruleoprunus TaxID=285563 RepID=A0ABV9XHK4_9ACTN
MANWTFRTPSVDEGPAVSGNRLMRFYKLARGITILNRAGVYTAVRYPTEDEIAAATTAYLGGHEYTVDDATKAALIAAGVGVTEANFTAL